MMNHCSSNLNRPFHRHPTVTFLNPRPLFPLANSFTLSTIYTKNNRRFFHLSPFLLPTYFLFVLGLKWRVGAKLSDPERRRRQHQGVVRPDFSFRWVVSLGSLRLGNMLIGWELELRFTSPPFLNILPLRYANFLF